MGRRKRSDKSDEDRLENLLKKAKRILNKRRRASSSISDDDEPPLSPPQSSNLDLIASDHEIQDEIPLSENADIELVTEENHELDPNILELLGDDPTQNKSFGDNLHRDLASRWKYILMNGLEKDEKDDLLKRYLPAENCTCMKAPILNPEVKSALSELNVKRDSYSEKNQNQMSSCISAIGKALNLALSKHMTENFNQEIIKILSDAGRLLCDTHFRESTSRRFAIINCLSKQKRDVLKNTKIEELLFGSNLAECLKSNKAISASASELRFSANSNRINQRAQPSTSTTRYPQSLNARGTPRVPAEARVYPTQPRRPQPPPPAPQPREYRRAPAATRARNPNNWPPQARRR